MQVIVHTVDVGEPLRWAAAGQATGPAPPPAATRPAGSGSVPAGPKPDLRSLPAWAIEIGGYESEEGRDHLAFSATVWTAATRRWWLTAFAETNT